MEEPIINIDQIRINREVKQINKRYKKNKKNNNFPAHLTCRIFLSLDCASDYNYLGAKWAIVPLIWQEA